MADAPPSGPRDQSVADVPYTTVPLTTAMIEQQSQNSLPFAGKPAEEDQLSHDAGEDEVADTPVAANAFASYPKWLQPFAKFFRDLVPYGGIISNVFSLCSVTLGGAIISMPSSFATSGIAMSIIYLVSIATLTVYSMTMMGYAMAVTGARNFEECGDMLFGRGWSYFVGGVMWLSCVGTAIAYIGATVTLVTPIMEKSDNVSHFWKTTNGINVVVIIIWVVLLLPITVPKRLNTVRYVSVIGVSMVLYFVLCIVIHGAGSIADNGLPDDLEWFTTGNTAIYGLSIFVFAFMCQGVAFSVYYEMRPRRSIKQLTIASAIGMTACMIFYILAGFFGYADFGEETKDYDSVLNLFDPIRQPYIMVAYIGMLVKICAAYGMNMIPVRNFMYHCLRWDLDETPYWQHCTLIFICSAIVLVAGLYIPNMNLAFGLVGSLCGGFIGFIFPALFWMFCGNWSSEKVGWLNWFGTYFMLICGVIAICFGTVATVYSSFWDK